MAPRELEQQIRDLLRQPLADVALRERLEALALAEISFSGFTWLFGPELYRRNRILFRPLILSRFSSILILPKWRTEPVRWKGDVAARLESWMADTDRNDDIDLFRRLYEWKLTDTHGWRQPDARARQIIGDLFSRIDAASSAAQRQTLLRKFDLWYSLDEESACRLYSFDPRLAPAYILRRLPGTWLGEDKRRVWTRLVEATAARKDLDFQWRLYRKQIPLKVWTTDCLALCDSIRGGTELCAELEKRHPEGALLNLSETLLAILKKRGRDVFPYIARHLRHVRGGLLGRGAHGGMLELAAEKGWWDLWSALVRSSATADDFSKHVQRLVEDRRTPEAIVIERLRALAGASREWNWPGFAMALVHPLVESAALALYQRFPALVRGPFKAHIQANLWGKRYTQLLDHFIAVGDEEMVDHLASRIATRTGAWGNAPKLLEDAEKLAEHYLSLKSDEAAFSRRAASVLGRMPAYSIWSYGPLIRTNRLARLLFERSVSSYLADPRSIADLMEASEIHVMALAYRALGLDDPRARAQASAHLPLLLGTLLRPMKRETRALALKALANAAGDEASAHRILARARDALNLPDTRYPKELLLGLIGRILHQWPALRGAAEQPLVYERAAA